MPSPAVTVIDIGSNSIKLLVAATRKDGSIEDLHHHSIDARISAGIGGAKLILGEEGMVRGLAAIQELLRRAVLHSPSNTILVATSAVRDATNGADFRAQIKEATGHEVRLLSGDEEASLIGRGLGTDPLLSGFANYYGFDLGGGSLECLAYRDRKLSNSISLPLGCVRLTEKFVENPAEPITADAILALTLHVRESLKSSPFLFDLPRSAAAIGMGGTLTVIRAMDALRKNCELEETDPVIPVRRLRELLAVMGNMTLAERRKVPGLPPGRADVFPAALATFIALADLGRFDSYHNSLRNLRWGVACEALSQA